MTVGGEAMHPRVAIPVGDIQIARRVRNHLRGIVKGPGSARHQVSWPLTSRIRVGLPSRVYIRHTELFRSVRYTMSSEIEIPWAKSNAPLPQELRKLPFR